MHSAWLEGSDRTWKGRNIKGYPVEYFYVSSPEKMEKAGKESRKFAEQHFNPQTNTEDLIKLLERL